MAIPQSRLPHRHSSIAPQRSKVAILHASLDNHNNHSRLPRHQQQQQENAATKATYYVCVNRYATDKRKNCVENIQKKMRQTKLAKYPVQWMDICVVSFTLLQRLLSSKSRVNIMIPFGLITNMKTIKTLMMEVQSI